MRERGAANAFESEYASSVTKVLPSGAVDAAFGAGGTARILDATGSEVTLNRPGFSAGSESRIQTA